MSQQSSYYHNTTTTNEISFDEVQRKIQDVLRGYDTSANAARLARVDEMRREVDRQCQTQQQQLRLIVQKLQQRIDLTRQTAERTEPVEEYQQRMDLLTRELHDIETSCNMLDQQCKDVTERIRTLGEQLVQLEEDMVKQQDMFEHELHVIRAKEQLYAYLVPVVWDQSTLTSQQQQQEDCVQGFFNFVQGVDEDGDACVDDDNERCALHAFQMHEIDTPHFEMSRLLWQAMYSNIM